jgi:hypothetical protein
MPLSRVRLAINHGEVKMDIVIILIAQNDARLAAAARQQSNMISGCWGLKVFRPLSTSQTIQDGIESISRRFPIGSSSRLSKLHIVGHGRSGDSYIELGATRFIASHTHHFRGIRHCWINTGTVAPGACIEMNVCSAAGASLTGITMGLADDAGVCVKACPVPIEYYPSPNLYNPRAGFRSFSPTAQYEICEADYIDVEDHSAWQRDAQGYYELRRERTHREIGPPRQRRQPIL